MSKVTTNPISDPNVKLCIQLLEQCEKEFKSKEESLNLLEDKTISKIYHIVERGNEKLNYLDGILNATDTSEISYKTREKATETVRVFGSTLLLFNEYLKKIYEINDLKNTLNNLEEETYSSFSNFNNMVNLTKKQENKF